MKVLFIHLDSFSHINESILSALRHCMPEIELISLNAQDTIRKNRRRRLNTIVPIAFQSGLRSALFFNHYKIALLRTPFFFKRISKLVQDEIRSLNPDITFQTQSLFDFSVPGIPHFIYTDSTHLADQYWSAFTKTRINPLKWIALENALYQKACGIFVMSTHIKNSLIEHYDIPISNIHLVGAGSNLPDPQFEKPSSSYSSKNIVFVGVEWERKGGEDLWIAFKEVLKFHPDATLTIIGCEPSIFHPQVRILGKVPKEEISKYYHEAALFCMPSRLEPFGIVYLEAMQHALPIIGPSIGACEDLVEEGVNGFNIVPGDKKKLIKVLIQILGHPEYLEKMGLLSKQKYLSGYTWEQAAKRMYEVIEKIN